MNDQSLSVKNLNIIYFIATLCSVQAASVAEPCVQYSRCSLGLSSVHRT